VEDGRVMVVGAAGRLGRALMRALRERGRPSLGVTRAELDLAAAAAIGPFVADRRPAAVLNAAAYNDVDGAESAEGEALALRVNRDAPAALARACRAIGCAFVHVSTDYVFDGALGRPYREEDPAAPLQRYGRSKLAGERAVLESHPRALVVRTSAVFGEGPHPGFVDHVLRAARERGLVEVVEPPTASTTYATDLALALIDLLEAGAGGLCHVVNDGSCTRLELAREVVEQAGLAARVEVRRREPSAGGAERPGYSVLATVRLRRLLGRGLRPWPEALRAYVGR